MSSDSSFQKIAQRWTKNDLPISLHWRSSLWRYVVPALWAVGWLPWIWVMSTDTSGRSFILNALLFVSSSLFLAATAGWWVSQLLQRRVAGTLVINDDYLEWQFETASQVDLLADCGRFEFTGKRNYDARIEWDIATPGDGSGDDAADGWPQWTKRWRLLDTIKSDRSLYGRDVGLDRGDLESLCKLLNQLRDEAAAQR
jgi:hypothetical protein